MTVLMLQGEQFWLSVHVLCTWSSERLYKRNLQKNNYNKIK